LFEKVEKTFYIESLGCAKNQVDSEMMIAFLVGKGWRYVRKPDEAEVIIVNTCAFIKEAKEESIETTISLRSNYPEKKIIMAGCLTQRYGKILEKEFADMDGFIGNRNPELVAEKINAFKTIGINLKNRSRHISSQYRNIFLSYPGSVYVKISDGCDNRCSYCSIPLIRGNLRSRRVKDIMDEVSYLLRLGIIELNIVAQDLGSFGIDRGKQELPSLFQHLASLPQHFWLRPLYIHPDRFPHEILDIMKADSRFLPYFDIPFQHASERVLGWMGRKGTSLSYLRLIEEIRKKIPGAVIRSTFLVGFPGESDKDFSSLLDFQKRAAINWLGCFAYSREEGTPAFGLPGRVKRSVALLRKRECELHQIPVTERWLDTAIGVSIDVLIEETVEGEDLFIGRSYMQAPDVDGLVVVHGKHLKPGTIEKVKIIRRNGIDLEGVRVH
jgi:ribosomal protein S12 methylthiotransferase